MALWPGDAGFPPTGERALLCRHLAALGETLYRAKGVVPTRGGPVSLDVSVAGVEQAPAPADALPIGLAVIVEGGHEQPVRALQMRIKAGELDAT